MSTAACELCAGSGTLSWQQPSADGSVLRTIEMPCPHGCGEHWKHPAAEQAQVVEPAADPVPDTRIRGLADESQEIGAEFITRFLRASGH